MELGAGAHLLEHTHLGSRRLGTAFQFGSYGGTGLMFGAHDEYAVSLRVLHESNAGIKQPNEGLTVYQLRFEYTLQ